VNVLRFLRPACIRLELETRPLPPPEDGEETEAQVRRRLQHEKEAVMEELAHLLDASGELVNPTKFHKDLIFHERRNTTAVIPAVALPHVRSLQVRSFVMGMARAPGDGIWYDSLDRQPTRLFLIMAAPPWDDRTYLAVYREIAQILQDEETVDALMAAPTVNEVFNVLRRFFR
jgi:PTS system fructose-specific IIC component